VCIEELEEDKVVEHHFVEAHVVQKGCKGGKCCCTRKTIIHKSVVDNIASHRGANNGRSITKVDGDGVTWSGSGNEEKIRNHK